jgi:hypothetical protein
MPVNCAKCNTEIPVLEAWSCCCGEAFFCSEEHFQQDPHSKIEDDQHAEANELIQSSIDVKLSRLVGKGGYVDLMKRLVELILDPSKIPRAKMALVRDFGQESTKSNRGTVESFVTGALDSWTQSSLEGLKHNLQELETIWKKDSPRSKQQIEAAMTAFFAALEDYETDHVNSQKQAKLKGAGFALGNALNGSRK